MATYPSMPFAKVPSMSPPANMLANCRSAAWEPCTNELNIIDETDKLKEFFNQHGFSIEVAKKCHRIFSVAMIPMHKNGQSAHEYQLYCGHIPNDVTDSQLFDLLSVHGKFYELRLIFDGDIQKHRGYAFIKCCSEADQKSILNHLNGYEIKPNKCLKLNIYKPNRSLYIANIPKSKTERQLRDEFDRHLAGIVNLIIYRPVSSYHFYDQNRGFCFLEFDTHEMARVAKRRIETDPCRIFATSIFVDWADLMETPTEEIMQSVRVLYVRNIHESVTEIQLRQIFGAFGSIEHLKRIKNFAFIHFVYRADALSAMKSLQNLRLCGESLSISLSYPPMDKKRREEILRLRQQRIMRENTMRLRPVL